MAQAIFTDSSVRTVKSVKEVDSNNFTVRSDKTIVKVTADQYETSSVKNIRYGSLRPILSLQKTEAKTILPFRVKFTSISIEGFTASRPAPIGIAVIGVNNYIL